MGGAGPLRASQLFFNLKPCRFILFNKCLVYIVELCNFIVIYIFSIDQIFLGKWLSFVEKLCVRFLFTEFMFYLYQFEMQPFLTCGRDYFVCLATSNV